MTEIRGRSSIGRTPQGPGAQASLPADVGGSTPPGSSTPWVYVPTPPPTRATFGRYSGKDNYRFTKLDLYVYAGFGLALLAIAITLLLMRTP
jgi:hypothetical protein